MKKYKQLNLSEREELYALRKVGFSLSDIGSRLKRNKGTISRELKRNVMHKGGEPIGVYIPCRAQEKAKKRQIKQRREASWKGPAIYLYIRDNLKKGWSPEEIAGRLSTDHPELSVSTETVYQHIYHRRNKKQRLWKLLMCARKKRMKKDGRRVKRESKIPEAKSIDLRPEEVNNRETVGHWETDNLGGQTRDKTALSVTIERKFRYSHVGKLKDRKAKTKTAMVIVQVQQYPKELRQTMTTDNGSENTNHQEITKQTNMPVYFCHAYHSWEKGGVENMNQRIRRFIPKRTSIDTISERQIQAIEDALNNTPRKCLNFKTPKEALEEYLTAYV